MIASAIAELRREAQHVVTTGGTGSAPRDVTPEATLTWSAGAAGIPEALRADSISETPHGLLSRGVAGVLGKGAGRNLLGSTGGCRDGYAVLRLALGHAVELLAGEASSSPRQT